LLIEQQTKRLHNINSSLLLSLKNQKLRSKVNSIAVRRNLQPLLRSTDSFLETFLFHSVYGHQDTDQSSSRGRNTSASVTLSYLER